MMERIQRVVRIWRAHGFWRGSSLLIEENSRHAFLAQRLACLMICGERCLLDGVYTELDAQRQEQKFQSSLELGKELEDRIAGGDWTEADILAIERQLAPLFAGNFPITNGFTELVKDLRRAMGQRLLPISHQAHP